MNPRRIELAWWAVWAATLTALLTYGTHDAFKAAGWPFIVTALVTAVAFFICSAATGTMALLALRMRETAPI